MDSRIISCMCSQWEAMILLPELVARDITCRQAQSSEGETGPLGRFLFYQKGQSWLFGEQLSPFTNSLTAPFTALQIISAH